MATFPSLKTGAVVQYPLTTATSFLTSAVEFLDGSRQAYQLQRGPLRKWSILLDRLDTSEISAIAAFSADQSGNTFEFQDPVSGLAVPKCVLDGGSTAVLLSGEFQASTRLTVVELP